MSYHDDYGEEMDCDEIQEIEHEARERIARDEQQVEPGLCAVNGRWAMRHFPVEDY